MLSWWSISTEYFTMSFCCSMAHRILLDRRRFCMSFDSYNTQLCIMLVYGPLTIVYCASCWSPIWQTTIMMCLLFAAAAGLSSKASATRQTTGGFGPKISSLLLMALLVCFPRDLYASRWLIASFPSGHDVSSWVLLHPVMTFHLVCCRIRSWRFVVTFRRVLSHPVMTFIVCQVSQCFSLCLFTARW